MAKAKAKVDEEEKLDDVAKDGVEGGENPEDAPASPPKSKKKKIIIAVILLLVLIGGGVGAFMLVGKKAAKQVDESISVDEHGNPISKAVYYTMPQFLVNLNASSKSQVFLKATVILEVQKATDVPFIESNLPRLVDGINTYLRELRSSDLAGSAGIQRLREEILLRVNKAIVPVQVNDVLFKEIIVQ